MHVLHLVESFGPESPGHCPSASEVGVLGCRAALEEIAEATHTVCLLADTDGERRVRALGLFTTDRITPPLRRPGMAWRALRALRAGRGPFDAIQCWDERLVPVARRAFGPARVVPPPRELALPSVVTSHCRARTRRELGLADDDLAVLLLADPRWRGNAQRFTFLIGLFDFAGYRTVGVIPRGAVDAQRAGEFHKGAMIASRLCPADRAGVLLSVACDVGVLQPAAHRPETEDDSATGQRRALVRAAQRLGLPVLAPRGLGVDDLCAPPGGPDLLARSDRSADLAKVCVPLLKDRAALEGAARAAVQVGADGSIDRDSLAALRDCWWQAAGRVKVGP
jgi:hypothetical protein